MGLSEVGGVCIGEFCGGSGLCGCVGVAEMYLRYTRYSIADVSEIHICVSQITQMQSMMYPDTLHHDVRSNTWCGQIRTMHVRTDTNRHDQTCYI